MNDSFQNNKNTHQLATNVTFALMAIFFITATPSKAWVQHTPQDHLLINSESKNMQIKKMAAYNTWANQQFVQWLSLADSTQWHMNIQSSYNTLELTLRHLWNAEHGWLSILKKMPWQMAVESDHSLTQADMLEGFIKTSLELQHFVESMGEEELLVTRNIGKENKPVAVADIILHVFNHATYHRGQLITMGRQAGLGDPPRTDLIYFLMMQDEKPSEKN